MHRKTEHIAQGAPALPVPDPFLPLYDISFPDKPDAKKETARKKVWESKTWECQCFSWSRLWIHLGTGTVASVRVTRCLSRSPRWVAVEEQRAEPLKTQTSGLQIIWNFLQGFRLGNFWWILPGLLRFTFHVFYFLNISTNCIILFPLCEVSNTLAISVKLSMVFSLACYNA